MDGYNFWQDLFDTYQSLSDWLKTLWLIVPPVFVFALIWIWKRPTTPPEMAASTDRGKLLYSVYRDADNRAHIVSYEAEPIDSADILLLDTPQITRPAREEAPALTAAHTDNSEGR